jgi:hypothetical protein
MQPVTECKDRAVTQSLGRVAWVTCGVRGHAAQSCRTSVCGWGAGKLEEGVRGIAAAHRALGALFASGVDCTVGSAGPPALHICCHELQRGPCTASISASYGTRTVGPRPIKGTCPLLRTRLRGRARSREPRARVLYSPLVCAQRPPSADTRHAAPLATTVPKPLPYREHRLRPRAGRGARSGARSAAGGLQADWSGTQLGRRLRIDHASGSMVCANRGVMV